MRARRRSSRRPSAVAVFVVVGVPVIVVAAFLTFVAVYVVTH